MMLQARHRSDELSQRLDRVLRVLHEGFDELSQRVDLIDRTLLVRDPGSVKAADAYEGLRRQVVAAVGERRAHLAQLAQLHAAVRRGESLEALEFLLEDLMHQAGLARMDTPERREAFEVIAGQGDQLVVLEPAYVDVSTGQLVRQGRAKAEEARPTVPTDGDNVQGQIEGG